MRPRPRFLRKWIGAFCCAAILGLIPAPPLLAQPEISCRSDHALYRDSDLRFELQFRPARSWEGGDMTLAVFEARLADGRALWGRLSTNMGVSRDVGQLYYDCPRPGPDEAFDAAAFEGCKIWEGVVYGLEADEITGWPLPDAPAPKSLIMADLGRQLRYALLEAPGEEPWDQLYLAGCSAD